VTALDDYYNSGRTSPFGDCRPVGTNPCGRRHRGQDFSHSRRSGTVPALALLAGEVISKTRPSNQHGFGWGITVRSGFEGKTLDISYSHGPWDSSQRVGERVAQGQGILHEGLSGFTDGPCCHIEIYVHGVGYVDPIPVIQRILRAQNAPAQPAATGTPTPVSELIEQDRDMPINFRNPVTGVTYTMVPGYSIRAHHNAFGERLTNFVNDGSWPASESLEDRYASGLRDLNRDHVLWMLPYYGFARFTPESLPTDSTEIVYADEVQAQHDMLQSIWDSIRPGESGVRTDGQLWAHVRNPS
jgi:hypothetical protein